MWIGPPKALDMPKPMSSMRTMRTLGAPSGAFTSKRGGGVTLRASSSVIGGIRRLRDRQHRAVEHARRGRRRRSGGFGFRLAAPGAGQGHRQQQREDDSAHDFGTSRLGVCGRPVRIAGMPLGLDPPILSQSGVTRSGHLGGELTGQAALDRSGRLE